MTRAFSKSNRILWMDEKSKPRSAAKRSRLLFPSLFILCLILASLFYVWSRVQVIRLGYEISSALRDEKKLSEASKKLRLEIATLKSYSRIERVAVEELKMSKPAAHQVIVIR